MATKKANKKGASASAAAATKPVVRVLNLDGKEVGTLELNPEVFGVTPNESLVHDTVRWQLARRRSGTHQALTRSMMRGGGKKPFRQKGTGRARAGSIISPLWVGGASVHGPLPRDYDYRLPKRTRRQALASVLSDKVQNSKLVIVDELNLKEAKTKVMAKTLDNVGVAGRNATIIVHSQQDSVAKASRNLPKVVTLTPTAANVYDLLRHDFIVISKDGVKAIEERVLRG
ncbi:MAG: 50S ribosomal protein L4 [Proteobacteria bacterium]|nr:50S ribosomal protein L4 [Pseudomonadota bacterium]